jgi:hypothetical protein
VSFIIFIVGAFAAYKAFKARSPLGLAGAGLLLGLVINYEGEGSLFENLLMAVAWHLPTLVICAAVAYAGAHLYFRSKGQLRPTRLSFKRSDDLTSDMKLVVGRVLDTRNSQVVLSNTHVHQNAMGHLDSYTTHDVQVSHNTWLYDINHDVDVNYSGSGSLQARAGHILGTMSWKGQSFLDINFSTDRVFSVSKTPTALMGSLIWGGLLIVFGPLLFPLFMLLSPMTWLGWFQWNGKGGAYSKHLLPNTHRIEAILTYGGGLAYLIAAFFMALPPHSGEKVITGFACLFAVFTFLHQHVVKSLAKEHDALLAKGREELTKLYNEGMARQAAKAGIPASNEPVTTPAVAS